MSQASKIYQFLSRSKDPAADRALTLAFERTESPYDQVILETILDRANPETSQGLIENYHHYDADRQQIMISRVKDLFGGLNRAYRHEKSQTRLNVLTLLHRSGDIRLAHIAAELMSDSVPAVAHKAGEVLCGLAMNVAKGRYRIPVLTENDDRRTAPAEQIAQQRRFLEVLQKAVWRYRVHHRHESLMAAMLVVPADADNFWNAMFETAHPVGKAIQTIMTDSCEPLMARFVVTALRHSALRVTAARVISSASQPGWLGALARETTLLSDGMIRVGLQLVRQPRWLSDDRFDPNRFTARQQYDLAGLIAQTGIEESVKKRYLGAIIGAGEAAAAKYAFENIDILCESSRIEVCRAAIASSHEDISLLALKKLVEIKPLRFKEMLAGHLNSPHPKVREFVMRYFRGIAFNQYWNHFDDLHPAQRAAAGRAIFKIDPDAQRLWAQYARDVWPINRLQAIRVARVLGRIDQCLSEIITMTKDTDHVVRSSAVAALGELKGEISPEIEPYLQQALNDNDPRVRANAVEALENSTSPANQDMIESLAEDPNNRVRANAIKAMMNWHIGSARQSIDRMLSDVRPSHRRSARWVVRAVASRYGSIFAKGSENINYAAAVTV